MSSSKMEGRRRHFIYNADDYKDNLIELEKDHILWPCKDFFKVLDFFVLNEPNTVRNFEEFIDALKNDKDSSFIEDKIEEEIILDEAKMKGEFMKQKLNQAKAD